MHERLKPNEHAHHALPEECVFISALSAVGGYRYLYCSGSDLDHLTPRYFGKPSGYRDIIARYKITDPADPRIQPGDVRDRIKHGTTLAIPVPDADGRPKGFLLLGRKLEREHGESGPFNEMDRKIATFIVNANARFIEPKAGEATPPSEQESLEFLKGLNDLFLEAIKAKHRVTYEHIVEMTKLVTAFAKEINDSEHIPFKIDDKNLEFLTLLASLHDIGKYQTPVNLLNNDDIKKDNEQNRLQWAIVKKHVDDSRDIIDVPIVDRKLAMIVSEHHMEPAGGGYPYIRADDLDEHGRINVRGDLFPDTLRAKGNPAAARLYFEAKLLQLCDQFEAATGARHANDSRKPKPSEKIEGYKNSAGEWVDGLVDKAKKEQIDPYLCYAFLGSRALRDYCENSAAHFEHSAEETNARNRAIMGALADTDLQKLRGIYLRHEEPVLFEHARNKSQSAGQFRS